MGYFFSRGGTVLSASPPLPPAAPLKSWESEIIAVDFHSDGSWSVQKCQEVNLGCDEGRREEGTEMVKQKKKEKEKEMANESHIPANL